MQIWETFSTFANPPSFSPTNRSLDVPFVEWFSQLSERPKGHNAKGVKALATLLCWEVWLERNRRIFHHKELLVAMLIVRIRNKVPTWKLFGCPIPFDLG